MIVTTEYVGHQVARYLATMGVEVFVEVVSEHLGKDVDLCLGAVVHVALNFYDFTQVVDIVFARFVVFEAFGVDKRFEVVVDFVGDLKFVGRWCLRVLGDIFGRKVKRPVVAYDVVDDAIDFAPIDNNVGYQSSSVAHFSAVGCLVDVGTASRCNLCGILCRR